MHTEHGAVFSWLCSRFPGGKLYGPYGQGGRRYYQWMLRGKYLREEIIPLLDDYLLPTYSTRVYARYVDMKRRYNL